jgi:hypothetical protein
VYSSWILKKYAAAEGQKSEGEAAKGKIRDNDLPFGSRAIESGIQIEGIWISKS